MRCIFCIHFVVFSAISLLPISSSSDYIISKEALAQLDDWEINVLRDFIRGRGKPIVKRIPLDSNGETANFANSDEESKLIDLFNPMDIPQGGIEMSEKGQKNREKLISMPILMAPPQPITQFINPNSKRKLTQTKNPEVAVNKLISPPPSQSLDEPSIEDYEQLTNVIQMFIDRRTEKKQENKRTKSIIKPESAKTRNENLSPSLPDQIITHSTKKDQQVTFDTNMKNKINKWSPMERFTPQTKSGNGDNQEDGVQPKTHENYEKKMKELSGELTKILKQLEESKSERQPQVIVLRNGSAEQTPTGQYIFIATITLIKDGDQNILVDTGLGTNINARTELLMALENHELNAASIDVVVSTHGHPDHTGGIHDFPDAIHYHSWYSHYKTEFNLTELFENDSLNLSENVMLVKAKGHTSDDIAVVVRDAKHRGDVLVSGDLFMRGEDIDHPMMWQPLSADIVAQRESRRRYGCVVEWIVPGHGPMFKVTKTIKKTMKC